MATANSIDDLRVRFTQASSLVTKLAEEHNSGKVPTRAARARVAQAVRVKLAIKRELELATGN